MSASNNSDAAAASSSSSFYDAIRANVQDSALDRVEVNQRALIDKILARYASAGAVYRELLQNSNDADADTAEIYFTTASNESKIVTQVVYRNNGMPFRTQDWSRLKKIAEGNPDVSKVGAFGVGAYTMFSICEEPLVLSGDEALAFVWKGDALYTKTGPNHLKDKQKDNDNNQWTSFILPSRDPYPLPDMVEFVSFLCASLTFTKCLRYVRVFVNGQEKASTIKTLVSEPRPVSAPKHLTQQSSNVISSWFSNSQNSVTTTTSNGLFSLAKQLNQNHQHCIMESVYRITVIMGGTDIASLDARFISATAQTKIPSDMARRMERVTKKQPPSSVQIHIFLNAQEQQSASITTTSKSGKRSSHLSPAQRVLQSFSPKAGQGRIFIGFRTSQTTGLAAHLAAPFVPTVEREAMDLQDSALRQFNMELLECSGILMRLILEDTMFHVIDALWKANTVKRQRLEQEAKASAPPQQPAIEAKGSNTKDGKNTSSTSSNVSDNDDDEDESDAVSAMSGGGLFGFARFMARGVTKKIVSVVHTAVEEYIFDDTAQYLSPTDPVPLMEEEEQAVVLMRSFCPQQSTPDPLVGMCIANGFSMCLPQSMPPPVLTRSGVVRGDLAKLPHYGIETFLDQNVVRSVVFKNAEEYHTVIAPCRKLHVDDLLQYVYQTVLEEERLCFLLKWWTKYARVAGGDTRRTENDGMTLKDAIRYRPSSSSSSPNNNCNNNNASITPDLAKLQLHDPTVVALKELLFYVEKDSLIAKYNLPIPAESVLDLKLQEKIGDSVLSDSALRGWFSPLPMEIWAEFMSHHPCMTQGRPEDAKMRLDVLNALCKEYNKRSSSTDRSVFGGFLASLYGDKKCIPFDTSGAITGATVAERPSDLYLSSAELKAFDGVGSFRKVSSALKSAGITDDFLLDLGVRKSVSVDFLFSSLDTLQWSSDPKPLVEYLKSATLTKQDLQKLSRTQYLPAEKDDSNRTYAPAELYLPNDDLRLFPFVKMLSWPSEKELSQHSENGKFLVSLGMKIRPPLAQILAYITDDVKDDELRLKCLDFLADQIGGVRGMYHNEYAVMNFQTKRQFKIIPSKAIDPLEVDRELVELRSPVAAYFDPGCIVMGFPVIDPALGERVKVYGTAFQCPKEPDAHLLLKLLSHLTSKAKQMQQRSCSNPSELSALNTRIETAFANVFKYLSSRSSDLSVSAVSSLRRESFIPCKVVADDTKIDSVGTIEWFRPDQVFFKREASSCVNGGGGGTENESSDKMTEQLFHVVEFSPFLAAAGVKQEATTKDLFILLLNDAEQVLKTLGGEAKYRALLRRIAANPPFTRVTPEIRSAPILLAYTMKSEEKKSASDTAEDENTGTYHLIKASDIFIIDNSFFGRMFPVPRAPHESDLEDFYVMLGSNYISKSVVRRFEVVGKPNDKTPLTKTLMERIMERAPLLVSPNVTSRPLVADAASVLTPKRLVLFEAANLMAVYSLKGVTRRNPVTCFSKDIGGRKNAIYVVSEFDWYDCGFAVGDLILKRCQLEDAFYISSLLEAPVEQLRARGFPVDRIIKPEPPPPPPKPVQQPEPVMIKPEKPRAIESAAKSASTSSDGPGPTIAQIPDKPSNAKAPGEDRKAASSSDASAGPAQQPQQQPTPPQEPPPKLSLGKGETGKAPGELEQMLLKQIYPDASDDYIKKKLGPNPSMDQVQALADEMSTGNYPRKNGDQSHSNTEDDDTSVASSMAQSEKSSNRLGKGLLRKKLGKAFSGLRPSAFGGAQQPVPPPIRNSNNGIEGVEPTPGGTTAAPPGSGGGAHQDRTKPVPPAQDAQSYNNLEQMLKNTVQTSSDVNRQGLQAQESTITSIPEGLDRGDKCEVIPGQSLTPFPGPKGNGTTHNGIKVFSAGNTALSEPFLRQNTACVDNFGLVLQRLCGVYDLKLSSVAIFYDPTGGTIAFNAGRALHFNVRFFHALHFSQNKQFSPDCYCYWYVTIAHELAHHMVAAHNKEHGFYTESYVTTFLPKLTSFLAGGG